MPPKNYVIIDKFSLPDGSTVIGLNTPWEKEREEWRNATVEAVKTAFVDKVITIHGVGYEFRTSVLGVDILTSIADFKNVFLKIESGPMTELVQPNDQLAVMDGKANAPSL